MCDSMGAKIVDALSKEDLCGRNEIDKRNADPHELVEITKADPHI